MARAWLNFEERGNDPVSGEMCASPFQYSYFHPGFLFKSRNSSRVIARCRLRMACARGVFTVRRSGIGGRHGSDERPHLGGERLAHGARVFDDQGDPAPIQSAAVGMTKHMAEAAQ